MLFLLQFGQKSEKATQIPRIGQLNPPLHHGRSSIYIVKEKGDRRDAWRSILTTYHSYFLISWASSLFLLRYSYLSGSTIVKTTS